MLLLADPEHILVLSGNGDVIEPDDGVAAIGSGGAYALSAARALVRHGGNGDADNSAEDIVRHAMSIAAEICVYTNTHLSLETLGDVSLVKA